MMLSTLTVSVVHSARVYILQTCIHFLTYVTQFFFLFIVVGKFGILQHSQVLTIMALIAFLVIQPATTQENRMNIIERLNYGVVFKQESYLHIAKEAWLHTFKVELPK